MYCLTHTMRLVEDAVREKYARDEVIPRSDWLRTAVLRHSPSAAASKVDVASRPRIRIARDGHRSSRASVAVLTKAEMRLLLPLSSYDLCASNSGGCAGRLRSVVIGTPTYHSGHRTGSLSKSCTSHMVAFGLGCHWQSRPGLSTSQKTYELKRATFHEIWSAPTTSLGICANIATIMIPASPSSTSISQSTCAHRMQHARHSVPSLLRTDDYIIYTAHDGGARVRVYVFNKRPR
jgi:hypothetical protein